MACACAALYFFNLRGDVLIQRTYRDDTEYMYWKVSVASVCFRNDLAEIFRTQILNNKDESETRPVRTLGSVSFLHMRHNDIHVLCVTRTNANAMMAFSFMTSVINIVFEKRFEGMI